MSYSLHSVTSCLVVCLQKLQEFHIFHAKVSFSLKFNADLLWLVGLSLRKEKQEKGLIWEIFAAI
jgi:hypothetical protein